MCSLPMRALFVALVCVAMPPAAGAAPSDSPPAGVTVTGHGAVTVDADELVFDVRLGPRRGIPGAATPASAAPSPQSLGDLEGAPRALARTLEAAGATDVTITLDATLTGANTYPFDVRGVLARPTHDRILSLILSGALATLPDGSAITVQAASGYLALRDCRALDERADAAAIDDARRRARAVAAHAASRSGAVRSLVSAPSFPTCPSYDPTTRANPFNGAPLPLDGPYRVTFARDVTATFAIR